MSLFDTSMSGTSTEMVSHLIQLKLPPTTNYYRFFSDDRDLVDHLIRLFIIFLFIIIDKTRVQDKNLGVVYYDSIKRELKRRLISEYRCDGRLKTNEESTRLAEKTLFAYTEYRVLKYRKYRCYRYYFVFFLPHEFEVGRGTEVAEAGLGSEEAEAGFWR
jgi:hypothetical protein